MFDLDKSIATWRHQYKFNRLFDDADIDELERHIRDQVEFLTDRGHDTEDAFRATLSELGDFSETESEYRKVFWSKLLHERTLRSELVWNVSMFKNYLKVTLRSLAKNRVYSLINISGLTVGMACCFLIFLVLKHEVNYDRFHENTERIFRMNVKWESPEFSFENALSSAPMGPAVQAAYPAVEKTVRFTPAEDKVLLRAGDKRLYAQERRFLYSDETIFETFSFGFDGPDPRTALERPFTMVLTRSMAFMLFGDENPIGKTVQTNNTHDYEVTGIVDDVPITAHFHFDVLASMASFNDGSGASDNNWGNNPYFTYLLLPDNYQPELLTAQFPDLLKQHLTDDQREWMSLELQPLTSIHLNQKGNEMESGSSETYLSLLWIIALLILAIACFNFINLATARAMTRSKEVSMRKVAGAKRVQLTIQFLTESTILTLVAAILAVGSVIIILPWFSEMIDKTLVLEWSLPLAGSLILATLAVGFLAGAYPALIMSKMNPVGLIKNSLGENSSGRSPKKLRSLLVVFQFSISVVLIVATIVVFRQLSYMQTKELGLQPAQIIAVPLRSESMQKKALLLKEQLLALPEVEHVAISFRKPSTGAFGTGFRREEWEENDQTSMKYNYVGYDYLKTLKIPLLAGRNFSEDRTTDTDESIIINEEAVRKFGWNTPEEAIGQTIISGSDRLKIVGVTADFHFQPMWVIMQPMVMALTDVGSQYLLMRVDANGTERAVAGLRRVWDSINPDWPVSYSFLDQDYAALYASETRFGRMFGGFTFLALFIAGLGLFGLASFSLERRRKELGIRKTLGATAGNIAVLLSIDVARLVLLANLLAWPIAYYGVYQWLQNYPFKTQIGLWMFALAAASTVAIAFISIMYQSFKALQANPVDSLRCE